jgi:hypothetical protein
MSTEIKFLTLAELEAGIADILCSPKEEGRLEMIVRRPGAGQREIIAEGTLDRDAGLVGDNWLSRLSSSKEDISIHKDMQIALMNSRVIDLLAQDRSRWSLAGDQLYIDLDLNIDNLPPGSQIAIGSAVIEITAAPHTGCGKFMEWYGPDAVKFVNDYKRKDLRLRGANAKIIQTGSIRVGDESRKLP